MNIFHACSTLAQCAVVVILLAAPPVFAFEYCNQSRQLVDSIDISLSHSEDAQLQDAAPAQLKITQQRLQSMWYWPSGQDNIIHAGFDYQYTIMSLNGVVPMSNGHLHIWNFPIGSYFVSEKSSVFYTIIPAVSVSSNAFKDRDNIDHNFLQLKTVFLYNNHRSNTSAWVLGFMSDHRFGPYLLYPVAGLCWTPAPGWSLQLALPDLSINRKFHNGFELKLFMEPNGNQWYVFSKDRTENSDLIYNAISFGLGLQWNPASSINVGVYITRETSRELSFVQDSGQLLKTSVADGVQTGIKAEILF